MASGDTAAKTRYCWLRFGLEARLRVLVRMDGPTITLEHYLDAMATGRAEEFATLDQFKAVTLTDPDRHTRYLITGISGHKGKVGEPVSLVVQVNIEARVHYQQYCIVTLSSDPNRADCAHFHGPLRVEARMVYWELRPDLCLERTAKPTDLYAMVATMERDKGCWVVVRSEGSHGDAAFPAGIHPMVEIEFPPAKIGDPPLKKQYPLGKFC